MKKEMLINVLQPEECRIAIVEDGILEELYVERASQESYVGNIYKGRIVNIEPSIQAAFVDFGIGRNGFLHVSDVDPVYFKHLLPKELRDRLEAEELDDGPSRSDPRKSRDRGDRGTRGDRSDRNSERGPRVTAPEAAYTVPTTPAQPITEEEDDTAFGEGLEVEFREDAETVFADEQSRNDQAELTQDDVNFQPGSPHPITPEVAHRQPEFEDEDEDEDEPFAAGLLSDDELAEETSESEPIVELTIPVPTASETPVVSESVVEEVVQTLVPVAPGPETAVALVAEVNASTSAPEDPPADAEKPAKARSRSRSRKAKETAGTEETTAEGEVKKPRARRPRKKASAESSEDSAGESNDTTDIPPDAEPRVMGGPERRTSADDEPEIQPFFDGASDDFDIEGPNDRFVDSDDSDDSDDDSEATGFNASADETGDSEEGEFEEEAPVSVGVSDDDDDDEFAPPRRLSEDDDGNGRGRGRGRGRRRNGDGGGRDRERDRDRGNRDRNGGSRSGPPSRDRGYPRPPIQEIFKRGQEVIVQVIKEGIGTKGPTLSTFISIAGRYLVLMPSLGRVGVSRKIEDPDARRRLRDIMNDMHPPKGVGFIVRTAAIDRNETELQNDMAYLLRLWQVVVRRIKRVAAPVEIYRESDMITRTIRDIFTNDIDTIYVDEEHAFAHASEFLQIVMPRFASRIRYYGETEPLFHKYRVDDEIAKINQRRLDLPGGGSIIVEQTEALVAIDVNSGTFRAENNAEETAFRMNMRAAKEIARQLRLRDLGGVIVNDFIDMRDEKHRRQVEDVLREALKRDRARTKILRISQFGIIEMTRQRIQPSLKKRIFNECSHCNGTGHVKNQETMGIEVMRLLQLAAHRAPSVTLVTLTLHVDVAFYLLNRKRKEIAALEEKAGIEVRVTGQYGVSPEQCEIKCLDVNGSEVRLFGGGTPARMFAPGARQPRAIPERRYPQPLD
ncbi:MAG: Rne/Rng family ribonuclease [Bacteroidales bacterium]|nr:Rne/Rng family ribonuclease [Bacteroidales bacterium]